MVWVGKHGSLQFQISIYMIKCALHGAWVVHYCKVIRIGKRVQPVTSKARQQ